MTAPEQRKVIEYLKREDLKDKIKNGKWKGNNRRIC